MSGEKQPELTPEQQQAQDSALIQGQFTATDAFERVAAMMEGFGIGFGGSGPGGFFGKTSFEGAQLNAMIDLVKSSNPDDLEDAGDALVKAKAALNKAAEELRGYVESVDWKGESGNEFRRFGGELANHASALATFANAAGTQMKVASTGLASVRNSTPPRDERPFPKKAEDFSLPERTDDNPEYAKALQVEKDRQEAINQMNRLASFYAVSEESLASQEPPKFPGMLKANVPRARDTYVAEESSNGNATDAGSSGIVAPQSATGRTDIGDSPSRTQALGTVTPVLEPNTSMQIDSVKAPPAPTAGPSATPVTPPTGTPSPSGGPVPPVGPGLVNTSRSGTSRVPGPTGTSRAGGPPVGRLGQPGAAGDRSSSAGRSAPTTGRPGVTGGGPPAGRSGGPGQTTAGRPGTPGQPAAGRAGTGGGTGPRAGRTSGIVGGTPQQRSTSGSSGSRVPRGTVIGGGGASAGRPPAGRVGQPGVIGANANGAPRPGGRGTASSNGVVGTPRGGAAGSRAGAGGFTQGGSGLVRGPGRNQARDEEQERTGSERPDYLTEDEETWAARRRGAVPPVIE
ncbi:hypothetical protein [Streptomyces sp. 35G-GA-8]|uniref:hypothetical protein n=1 Tax=Streptomyces sp. 35G-GA-8 TaxID=2939434 RepID=UPI00201F50BF|nr:hypothetical protein [Streptomyces sp. 35G-GA-8]MCL7382339.1 hypothetical protein [Streptomyces sp. 35G-GA-8]